MRAGNAAIAERDSTASSSRTRPATSIGGPQAGAGNVLSGNLVERCRHLRSQVRPTTRSRATSSALNAAAPAPSPTASTESVIGSGAEQSSFRNNTVAGNGRMGVGIFESTATGNLVEANRIGTIAAPDGLRQRRRRCSHQLHRQQQHDRRRANRGQRHCVQHGARHQCCLGNEQPTHGEQDLRQRPAWHRSRQQRRHAERRGRRRYRREQPAELPGADVGNSQRNRGHGAGHAQQHAEYHVRGGDLRGRCGSDGVRRGGDAGRGISRHDQRVGIGHFLDRSADPASNTFTATATDPNGNTSEFSAVVAVHDGPDKRDDYSDGCERGGVGG